MKPPKNPISHSIPDHHQSAILVHCSHAQLVDVTEIVANPRNPNKHSDKQVALLAKIIRHQGWRSPITVSNRSGFVVTGHGRLQAAILLGEQLVPVDRQDFASEADEWAHLVADNRIAELADADKSMIADLLKELDSGGLDMDLTGFDMDALDELLTETDAPDITEDEVPDLPVDPITQPGDLWILGEHRMLCGDSTKAEDVGRLMAAEKVNMCFTSPPYNSKDGGYKTDYAGKTKKFYNHQCDDRTEDEWVQFCDIVLGLISGHLASAESPVVWNVMYTANCRSGYGRTMFAGSHGLSVKETICWDKGAGFPTASKGILSRNWEMIFVLSSGDKYTTTQGKNEPRWAKWDISRPKQQEEHKATFPVDLAARAMSDFGANGDRVYDPFLGSGTTLIAAEQLGRKCYGMEISPAYCDVIVKRWENLTGKNAVLSND